MPAWFVWFQIANTLVVVVAAILLATLRLGAKGSEHLRRPDELAKRLDQMETDFAVKYTSVLQRLDRAGAEMSKLATEVQGMPERFRMIFLSLERGADLFFEAREDRKRLWHEVEQIRETLQRRPRRTDEADS